MSAVKVNPKLFGTCRLCLEDMGQYLIVPKVQQQIQYCFGINIEPFDGLPQLLCNKCGGIVKNFFETKKNFVDNQNNLKNKVDLEKKQKQHLEDPNNDKQDYCGKESSKSDEKKRKQIVLSFSCSKLDHKSQHTISQDTDLNKSASWSLDYDKQYACRLCNYRGRKKQSIFRHTAKNHIKLKAKHENILKSNCRVKLDKIDNLPNITGLNDTVVLSTEKIVQDIDVHYCIIYSSKASNNAEGNKDTFEISSDDDIVRKKKKISDDDDEDNSVRKQQKIAHDDTLKEKKGEFERNCDNTQAEANEITNGDCIKIDDSSDSASEKNYNSTLDKPNLNNAVSLQKVAEPIPDHVTKIQNIISMCQNKYKKNIDLHKIHNKQPSNPALSKSQLKHKVLSIGRKIINKQGFNCTGLLRYMEHRNLEIVWTPNTSNSSTDTNYVRIMTKLSSNVVDEDDSGWKTCKLKSKVNDAVNTSCDNLMPKISQVFYFDKNTNWQVDTKNKLLNKNPVSNPKQMPRKSNMEKEKKIATAVSTHLSLNDMQLSNLSVQENIFATAASIPDLYPVLSATLQNNNEQSVSTDQKENQTLPPKNNGNIGAEFSVGTIKVKPLAELLPKQGTENTFVGNALTSGSMNQNNQATMFNYVVNTNDLIQATPITQTSYIGLVNQAVPVNSFIQPNQIVQSNELPQTNYTVTTIHAIQPINVNQIIASAQINPLVQANQQNIVQANSSPPLASHHNDYVIMDTVELPSTKTNSPIDYLEKLLLMHDIYLLDQRNNESSSFVSLIRFKVLYKQESMEDPILLSLSLNSNKNKFCLRVKNAFQEDIDISKISANWQWEIIKVFKGDVASKLLQNAQKVNKETHEYAKTFLFLLKSINYTKL